MGINDTATGLQMTKEVLTNQLKEITKNFDVDSDITNFYNGLIAGLNIGLIHARKVIQKTKKDLKM
jgi:hypothetical protein